MTTSRRSTTPSTSKRAADPSSAGGETLAAIWALRLLLKQEREFYYDRSAFELAEETAALVGVRVSARSKTKEAHTRMRARLAQLERVPVRRDSGLLRNADLLARLLRLTPCERDVLLLGFMSKHVPGLTEMSAFERCGGFQTASRTLARALGCERRDVDLALRKEGTLRRSGLLDVNRELHEVSLAPSEEVSEALQSTTSSAHALMRHFVRESPATRLTLADFAHAEADADSIVRLVRGALSQRARGVNVLLHGKPGTGKTELARVVASAVRGHLYEVADAKADGEPLDSGRRLAMCAVAHRVLGRMRRAVLVFDEIEDVFPSRWHGSLGLERGSTPSKSWTHRLLEEAPVPTFWIANNIEQIEAATLRRFDLVIELAVPPQAVRRRMITRELAPASIAEIHLDRLAIDERLAPAHLSRAVRVAGLMGATGPEEIERSLAYVLERNLAAQSPVRPRLAAAPGCGPYDPAFVNASADLGCLAEALARTSQAALCLYGPPGTGKTAWVAHLAEHLGRPLRAARASDLIDCWVGGTEKNLADAFRAAAAEKALLFLDEADSFLQERSRARNSWEVTQVNELLVQMEAFPGLFICATNLVDALDQASLRRFAFKVEFRPLRPEQRWAMFQRLAGSPAEAARDAVERLHGLTPGDFATVARQVRLVPTAESGPGGLIALLERELALRKGGAGRAIGFATTRS